MEECLTAGAMGEMTDYVAPEVTVLSASSLASITSYLSSGGGYSGGGGNSGGGSPSTTIDTWWTSDYVRLENALVIHFGFDTFTAGLISTFLYRIKRYYPTTQTWQRLEAAWRFFRLLGGCVYGKESSTDRTRWDAVAGSAYSDQDPGEGDPVSAPELTHCTVTLGMNQASYRHMRHMIRLQNQLCSLRLGSDLETDEGLTLTQSDYQSAYEFAMHGTSVGSDGFAMVYNQIDEMKNRPDFAHFCITTAAILATAKGYGSYAEQALSTLYSPVLQYLSGPSLRESMAGWLGDTVLGDSANPPSMGDDDYWADVDALRVGKTLSSNGYNVPVRLGNHFVESGQFERRGYFQGFYSADDAAKCIGSCLSVGAKTPAELMTLANESSLFEAGAKLVRTILNTSGCTGCYGEGTYNGE